MEEHNNYVEQVGFVNTDLNNPELFMAGGEFCGNASRSATLYYLNGKPGEILLKVSGVANKLRAGIDKAQNVWVEMPVIVGNFNNSIKFINDTTAIVKMFGITHMIVNNNDYRHLYELEEELKKESFEMLEKYGLTDEPAAGVMYLEKNAKGYVIHPIVYVKAINTLFYETACGSGTTAVGLYEGALTRNNVDINIMQPSNESINVKVEVDEDNIKGAVISGPVRILKK
jgi:diaminopimelate epimerase